jgi:sugar/nucleoside kinase (ribokinase family)
VNAPDLVILGNLLVDDVVLADGRTRMGQAGGATLFAALSAALWGLRPGLVSLRGHDYPADVLRALHERGVDLTGVRAADGVTLRAWILYEGTRRRIVHRLDGPTHDAMSPRLEHVPAAWRAARAFHVAPMPFEVQAQLVAGLRGAVGGLIALDPWLPLGASTLAGWRNVLSEVDVLFVGEDELEARDEEPASVARRLAGGRLSLLFLKRGARGGVACTLPEGRRHEWTASDVAAVDPTGAGDAFATGTLAGLLRGDPVEQALRRGIVSASFAVEDWGAAGLLRATPEEAEERLRRWF